MAMQIEVVLFDANGVIQHRPPGWKENLGRLLGFDGESREFLTDVFASEMPAVTGQDNFPVALSKVLLRWNCRLTLDEALRVWTAIEVDPVVTELIGQLRKTGTRCCLASNQEEHKARYMSESLGYRDLFDKEFYSCRVGCMKPNADYFRTVIDTLGLPPSHLLFIDDREENVNAAKDLGMVGAQFHLDDGYEKLCEILGMNGLSLTRKK